MSMTGPVADPRRAAHPRRGLRGLLIIAVFAMAALLSLGGASWAVGMIERAAERSIVLRLAEAGLDWAEVSTDGLRVQLAGKAGSEAERFRALSIAAEVVDAARVIDAMEVADPAGLAPPRFVMEILRNDDGVSLIGLVPEAFGRERASARINRMTGGAEVADMLETADHPIPEGWAAAVDYGLAALALLPRSKISIAPERVAVTAITDSRDEHRRIEAQLARSVPEGLVVALEISAPRPVITPFTLRFVMDSRGARFDACAADTEAARTRILAAGAVAGAEAQVPCPVGLGVPSPEWGVAAEAGIRAVARLGAGTVTFSDADVSLIVPHTVEEAAYDAAAAALGAALPEVFSLDATRLPAPVQETEGGAEPLFTAELSEEGAVLLRGRITDARMRDAVLGLARARFGGGAVQSALRLDEAMPEGWPRRVLTGIDALAELHEGRVTVHPARLEISGRSGDPEVSDRVAGILADRLGRGQVFEIDIAYDERLDPVAMAPTPERCISEVTRIATERKITFAPGSARLDSGAASTLDQIAEILRECGALELEIAGHTDSQGREEMNLTLSQRRAEAVRDALASRRVLVSGISPVGYGQTRPIADNATAAGREANRRIEFSLILPPPARDAEAEAALVIPVAEAVGDTVRPQARPAESGAD